MGKQEFYVFVSILILLFSPFSLAQLSESEARSLFRIRRQLENPPVLSSWNRYTDFCSLPPSPSLTIACTQNHVTELTVIGNKGSPSLASNISPQNFAVSPQSLSSNFSIESLFITLSKLQNLEVLSLVSLGLWGALPARISLLSSLRVLNASSNFIYGNIPSQISSLSNLRSLVLHHNLVDGIVPDLSSLIELEELDLSNNFLGPKFPSLGNKLVIVVLRNNTFRSNIPSQLQYFDQLQKLDLSFNKLIGPIPSPLFSLPAIEYLNLAGNGLSGTLPLNISCNGELGFVDLSHNLLFGQLPLCIRSNSSNMAVLYSWNCLSPVDSVDQHPYAFCHKEALAAFIPDNGNKSKSKLSLVLGIGGAIVGGFAILGIIMCVIYKKMGGKKAKNVLFHRTLTQKASISFSPRLVADGRNMSLGVRLGALVLPPYHIFTLEELEEATNNFDPSNLIREGSKGQIYKGWLRDGSAAVVRCLNLKQKYSPQSLKQLIELLSKLRHRHLVSVLGHCIDSETLLLVSEYVSNGTLRSHLTEETNEEMLGWTHRVTAAISVARGIQFLHTGMVPGIFGSDLRIENILLDENLTAKVNGYRLPLLTRDKVESESPFNAGGTVESGSVECGEKEDIYQLGAILLEVITGKRITSQSELNALKLKIERSLKGDSNKLKGLTDPTMSGTFAYDSVRTAVEVAVNCLSKDLRKRPSIEDVLWNLQYSIQVQDGWANSGNLSMHS